MIDDPLRIIGQKLPADQLVRLAEQLSTGTAVSASANTADVITHLGTALDLNEYRRGPGVATPQSAYAFKKTGAEVWLVRYDGTECQLTRGRGMDDIQYLLGKAGRLVDIFALPGNQGRGEQGAVDVASKDNGLRIKCQINDLEAGIKGLEGSDDPIDIIDRKERESKKAALEKQYNENFDKSGNPRQLAGDEAKAVKATKGRIDRMKERIQKHLPGLADHLDGFLTIGAVCQYTPDRPILWDLG